MPAAMFAAAHLAPAAAHRQSAHGVTRAAVYRAPPRARALPSSRAGRDSVKARAWWKFGGGAEAAEDTERAAAPAEPSGTSAKKTIDALSALLGEEDAEEEERRREEEADLARAAAQSRLEAAKAAKSERLKTYLSASTATLRAQQLQMLFLDMPIVPPFMQGAFLSAGKDAQTKTSSRRVGDPDASVLSPYDGAWFDANIDEAAAGISLVSSPVDSKARTEELFGEDLTPAFVAYDGEKLPGEFSVPIVPYPYVCLPGSRARLNLFEPRWLTLFAKLLAAEGSDGSTLEGARDNNRIDLGRNPSVRAYEADDDGTYDIVPGKGRFDETPFVGTGAYGSLFRRADGKLAGVGTLMRVEAHDVVVDGQLLSVYAKGTSRFRVLRVRQANPYIVVDAVPIDAEVPRIEEEEEANLARGEEALVANNIVAGASDAEAPGSPDAMASLDAVLGTKDEEEPSRDAPLAVDKEVDADRDPTPDDAPALKSAKGLARVVERLIKSDPYYSEAVGLDEAWRDTSLRRDVFEMSDFEVANAMLYATPELALAILACEDDAKRRALTETVASGMEAAVAAGLTPRKARLFKSLGAFAVLFALGFGVACARDLVEANWPQ